MAARMLITYQLGLPPGRDPHNLPQFHDLRSANQGALRDRVGLGRAIELIRSAAVLEGGEIVSPFDLAIPDAYHLADPDHRKAVATLLALSGSRLRVNGEIAQETDDDVLEILNRFGNQVIPAHCLETRMNPDVEDTRRSASPMNTSAGYLIGALGLTGSEAAAVLNAAGGATRPRPFTARGVLHHARRYQEESASSSPGVMKLPWTGDWSLAAVATVWGSLRVPVEFTIQPEVDPPTPSQYAILTRFVAEMGGRVISPSPIPPPRTLAAQRIFELTPFYATVLTGRYSTTPDPTCDLRAAGYLVRKQRDAGASLHELARRLNDFGYRTVSGRGVWHPAAVRRLLAE
jgi:hypothetical protein